MRTEIKRQSVALDKQWGHIFTVMIQGLEGFDKVDSSKDTGSSPKRTALTFQLGELGPEAIKLVGRWFDVAALKLGGQTQSTIGPLLAAQDPVGKRQNGFLVASPYGLNASPCSIWSIRSISVHDILRLFLDWVDAYHEAHFAVIREIYKNQGPTRYDIWVAVYGEPVPRDNSAEADLFRMLIRDLSTGRVIRQPRESDLSGKFMKQRRPPRRVGASNTMESAFEDSKQYVLTELGSQFVHYTMTELVQRLNPAPSQQGK